MDKKQNGLMPGWPPFTEFKKEMLELLNYALNETQKPIQLDMQTIKNSLIEHICKTEADFKIVKNYLSNHVTDTDKKIDSLKKDVFEVKKEVSEINSKLDNILKKQ